MFKTRRRYQMRAKVESTLLNIDSKISCYIAPYELLAILQKKITFQFEKGNISNVNR